MDTKRIRFGFVCGNATTVTSQLLCPPLGIRSMECALSDEKQFVIFTVDKSLKASDVLKTVLDTGLCVEKFAGCDELIVLFEKGGRYLQHPFYAVIQGVKSAASEEDVPPLYWQWESDSDEPVKHKRVATELASDLVEDSINPSAPKRERVSKADEDASSKTTTTTKIGKQSIQPTKGSYFMKNLSPVDMKLMSLVGEVTRSKDETIAAKNYAIQLLETMLKNATAQPAVVVEHE